MPGRLLAVPPGGFRHVAVLRLSSLGDVILTLPVVRALAAAFPGARITYWVKEEFQDVVRFEPAIHHVRVLEADARRIEDLVSMSAELEDCDLVVDLHGNSRTRVLTFRQRAPVLRAPSYRLLRERWVRARWTRPRPAPHALERYAEALAPLGVAVTGTPRVEVDPQAARWAEAWIAAWRPETFDRRAIETDSSWVARRPPVAICPGAKHATKRWLERHWMGLHERLANAGRPLVYLGTAQDRKAYPALLSYVEQDGRTRWVEEKLPRVAALLSHCAHAVTCDSGLMHLAAARGPRVVAMFGSTAPELGFTPAGEGHVVLCRREPCQPCTLHGRAECPKGHFDCMTKLEPAAVAAHVLGGD